MEGFHTPLWTQWCLTAVEKDTKLCNMHMHNSTNVSQTCTWYKVKYTWSRKTCSLCWQLILTRVEEAALIQLKPPERNSRSRWERSQLLGGKNTLPACFLQQHTRFLPTLVALAVVSRILQHYRLPLRTLHHVLQPLSQVGVSWQVSIHLRVQPWWWDHAGGLWIRLCDLLLHQTLRRSCASSSSGGLTVHEPLSAATAWARPGAAASAPGKAVVNIWAARPAGEAAPLMLSSPAHSLPLRDSLSSLLLSHSLTPLKKKKKGGKKSIPPHAETEWGPH